MGRALISFGVLSSVEILQQASLSLSRPDSKPRNLFFVWRNYIVALPWYFHLLSCSCTNWYYFSHYIHSHIRCKSLDTLFYSSPDSFTLGTVGFYGIATRLKRFINTLLLYSYKFTTPEDMASLWKDILSHLFVESSSLSNASITTSFSWWKIEQVVNRRLSPTVIVHIVYFKCWASCEVLWK